MRCLLMTEWRLGLHPSLQEDGFPLLRLGWEFAWHEVCIMFLSFASTMVAFSAMRPLLGNMSHLCVSYSVRFSYLLFTCSHSSVYRPLVCSSLMQSPSSQTYTPFHCPDLSPINHQAPNQAIGNPTTQPQSPSLSSNLSKSHHFN